LTTSPLLGEFKATMQRRSKALRNKLRHWACERSTDEVHGQCVESLIVDFHSLSAEFRLRLWQDGVLWFHVRELRAHRKVFELSFDASMRGASTSDLLKAVEASLLPGTLRPSARQAEDEILRVWASFGPDEVRRTQQ